MVKILGRLPKKMIIAIDLEQKPDGNQKKGFAELKTSLNKSEKTEYRSRINLEKIELDYHSEDALKGNIEDVFKIKRQKIILKKHTLR